jgi:hypothetical protein
MADITNDKGTLDEQPSNTTDTQNPPDTTGKELDREADQGARRASERIKRYDTDHNIFTK